MIDRKSRFGLSVLAVVIISGAGVLGTQIAGGAPSHRGQSEGSQFEPVEQAVTFDSAQATLAPVTDKGEPRASLDDVKRGLAEEPHAAMASQLGVTPTYYYGLWTDLVYGTVNRDSAAEKGFANADIDLTYNHTPMIVVLYRSVPGSAMRAFARGPVGDNAIGTGDVVVLVNPQSGAVEMVKLTSVDR